MQWSPAANYLASTNWDGGVRIWDVQESGGQIQAMPKAQGEFDFLFDDARCSGCILDIGDVERLMAKDATCCCYALYS